jgi:hypothetical protein
LFFFSGLAAEMQFIRSKNPSPKCLFHPKTPLFYSQMKAGGQGKKWFFVEFMK